MIGTAMAGGDGVYHLPTAFLALLGAVTIQIGTNLANDYFDFQKGADTAERTGPVRVTQAGLIPPQSVMCAFILAFSLAAFITVWLTLRAGWPIAALGILGILAGIFYTGGPWPFGYKGLGEIFVFFFFGPAATAGTYYVQSLELNAAVILAGAAPGLLSAAILTVNNLRDIETDRKAGKRTLAVRFGPAFARAEYYLLIVSTSLVPVIIYAMIQDHIEILFSALISVFALPGVRAVFSHGDGPALNRALADTGTLLFLYSILFSFGWIYADLKF